MLYYNTIRVELVGITIPRTSLTLSHVKSIYSLNANNSILSNLIYSLLNGITSLTQILSLATTRIGQGSKIINLGGESYLFVQNHHGLRCCQAAERAYLLALMAGLPLHRSQAHCWVIIVSTFQAATPPWRQLGHTRPGYHGGSQDMPRLVHELPWWWLDQIVPRRCTSAP